MPSEFLSVARQVLQQAGRPLKPKEIVSEAIRLGLFSDRRAGRTPHQTMKSKLSVHVRKLGPRSDFVRTAPGQFFLRQLLNPDDREYSARPLAKPHSTERVLVFDRSWLSDAGAFQGIVLPGARLRRHLLRPAVCQYLPRLEAEETSSFKQVLTYIMVTGTRGVLAYKRGRYNRVEDFLRGAYCIGFGGHVTGDDRTLFGTDMGVTEAAIRELSEELVLPKRDRARLQAGEGLTFAGLLNDDSSVVGERHFAIVMRYEVSDSPQWDKPERGEKSITQLQWLTPGGAMRPLWLFEYWSQLCLRSFFPEMVRAAPAYRIARRKPFADQHLLCVMGAVGSGKSQATRILCDSFGYTEVNTGKLVAGLLRLPPVPETPRDVFQRRAWAFIQTADGPTRLARRIVDSIPDSPRVLIDGIRQRATLEAIGRLLPGRRVARVFVHTPPDVAYAFYKEREKGDVPFEDFLKLRAAPVESEVPELIGTADAVLYNWTGRAAYARTVRALARELGVGGGSQ